MRTLYVTDLDGTLLRSNERTSDFTNRTINALVEKGMLFSYATARSFSTSAKVTKGLSAAIPLIVYNGALVIDNATGKILLSNLFGDAARALLSDLMAHGVYPIVYTFVDGVEQFRYVPRLCSKGEMDFIATREGDRRQYPVETEQELFEGDIFYFACIDEAEKLAPLYEKYKDVFHAVYQRDIYSGDQWLEIMPKEASKSNAIRQLKELLQCDRLVVFGDGRNDIDMFQLADESYAVANAVDELKAAATGVIGPNDEDSVAKWLEQRWNAPKNP